MKYKIALLSLLLSFVFIISCEKEFDPVTTFDKPALVVEGYIQVGAQARPPYVILTKSTEYSSSISQNMLNGLFVHDATITISDGTKSATLQELCVSDLAQLPSFLQSAIANAIGIPITAVIDQGLDICVYTDLLGIIGASGISPTAGGTYKLTIKAAGFDTVTAQTTIPQPVSLDSLTYYNHPQYPANDSMVELYGFFNDPAGINNYYRLFSQRNSENMYTSSSRGASGSVIDDYAFDGHKFRFNISRGQNQFESFKPETAGYFWRGDTVKIRLSTLDYNHFRFWQTLENNTGGQGPFGTYTRVQSNINGGLGIWGGIAYTEMQLIIAP